MDVALLPLLDAAAQQNHNVFAILAEIDPVPGAKSILYSKTPDRTPLTFEKFPPAKRAIAVATFTAACAFKLSNHAAYGLCPSRSLNSRTSTICDGNIYVTIPQAKSK
jgi:hypothetical protein